MRKTQKLFKACQTAALLLLKLGSSYDWTHALTDWRRGRTKGLRGQLMLLPYAVENGRPLYRRSDIGEFIKAARELDPALGPDSVRGEAYVFDDTIGLPWGSRRARRCIHRIHPVKPASPLAHVPVEPEPTY